MASATALVYLTALPSPRVQVSSKKTRTIGTDFRPRAKSSSRPPSTEETSSRTENVALKAAWYSSELLGIAASFFRPVPVEGGKEKAEVNGGVEVVIGKDRVVEAIKEDFQRSYFVTGNLTLNAYEEDCEFADPAGSFKGLSRFRRNCTNFGSLLVKSNMKLTKWEDFVDKGVGHWRFSCVMSFPWRPILSATGYTEYFFNPESGKIYRHVEHWNVPKMALFKQILKPSRWVWAHTAHGLVASSTPGMLYILLHKHGIGLNRMYVEELPPGKLLWDQLDIGELKEIYGEDTRQSHQVNCKSIALF